VFRSASLRALNDHVLKERWPSPLTGIASDLAGLSFFPLMLIAAIEMVGSRLASVRLLTACVFVTGVVFTCAEVVPAVEYLLEAGWGWSQMIIGRGPAVMLTADPNDLLALPVLGVVWLVGRRRIARAV
jgi:hypothetical protein